MIYLYYGDKSKAKEKALGVTASLLAKNPDALMLRVGAGDFGQRDLGELIGSQGLFKSAYVIVCDGIIADGDAEVKKKFLASVPELSESEHVVFIVEGKLLAADLKKLEKYAKKSVVCAPPNIQQHDQPEFNIFALTDALYAKDKKQLWQLTLEATQRGIADEEVHGVLFWAAKNLVLVRNAAHAEATGLKPFPYQKAKRALARFAQDEPVQLMQALATMPQMARQENMPLSIYLERFALNI